MSARLTRYGSGRPALIALLAAVIGSGLFLISQKKTASIASTDYPNAPAIVATVDGQTISSAVFSMYLRNGIEALGLNDQTDEGRRNIERLKRAIIDDLIDRVLIEKEALRAGLVPPDSQIADACAKKIREMGGDEMYLSYLAKHRLTEDDFRSVIRQEEIAVRALGHDALAKSMAGHIVTVTHNGQTLVLADNADIPLALRGYVQLALDRGILQAFFTLEQGPFDFQPTLKARVKPNDLTTRAFMAFALDNYRRHFVAGT